MLNRHGKFLIVLLLLVLVVLVIWLLPSGASSRPRPISSEPFRWAGQDLVTGEHVTGYIREWLESPCMHRRDGAGRQACLGVVRGQRRWMRSEELGELLDSVADNHGVDPLVLAVVVARESSFLEGPRSRRGGVGEVGLTQVHGLALREALRAGYDLESSEGQLAAGASYLARCSDSCDGSLIQALSRYQAGRCRSRAYGPRLRARDIRQLRDTVRPQLVAAR